MLMLENGSLTHSKEESSLASMLMLTLPFAVNRTIYKEMLLRFLFLPLKLRKLFQKGHFSTVVPKNYIWMFRKEIEKE